MNSQTMHGGSRPLISSGPDSGASGAEIGGSRTPRQPSGICARAAHHRGAPDRPRIQGRFDHRCSKSSRACAHSFGRLQLNGREGQASLWAVHDFIGAPGRIRTHDPQIRSLVLYPAELPAPGAGQGWRARMQAGLECPARNGGDIYWRRGHKASGCRVAIAAPAGCRRRNSARFKPLDRDQASRCGTSCQGPGPTA